jgi:DNA-binding beta-propeller fold protein YncE
VLGIALPAMVLATAGLAGGPGQGRIARFAGDGAPCLTEQCGAGGPAIHAQLRDPSGMATDARGDVYIADPLDSVVWKVSRSGRLTRFAGGSAACVRVSRCGDAGPARRARLNSPVAVATDARGDVYIVDQALNDVRRVSPQGIISRVAGSGRECSTAPRCGDGGPATDARLNQPWGVAVDPAGTVYIADYDDDEVRRLAPDGVITRFAGTGRFCNLAVGCGDGGPATRARLSSPAGLAIDGAGDVLIADSNDHEVRRVSPDGTITRLAGDGMGCARVSRCGDGGPATRARISIPFGVAVAPSGSVFVADFLRNDVRMISPSGTITRVAGTGRRCAHAPRCGDGGAALAAALDQPAAVAVDGTGRVYVADTEDHEVRVLALNAR